MQIEAKEVGTLQRICVHSRCGGVVGTHPCASTRGNAASNVHFVQRDDHAVSGGQRSAVYLWFVRATGQDLHHACVCGAGLRARKLTLLPESVLPAGGLLQKAAQPLITTCVISRVTPLP
jgi:hypothetical protein